MKRKLIFDKMTSEKNKVIKYIADGKLTGDDGFCDRCGGTNYAEDFYLLGDDTGKIRTIEIIYPCGRTNFSLSNKNMDELKNLLFPFRIQIT